MFSSSLLVCSFPDNFHPSRSVTKVQDIFCLYICKMYSDCGSVQGHRFLEQYFRIVKIMPYQGDILQTGRFFFFFPFSCTRGIWKFLGQGSNQGCCRDKAEYLCYKPQGKSECGRFIKGHFLLVDS